MDELVTNCKQRNSDADPRLVAQLYEEFAEFEREVQSVQKQRNDNAASMKVRPLPWQCSPSLVYCGDERLSSGS